MTERNIYISEDTLHYAAAFLERWEEKNPTRKHSLAAEEMRAVSNKLIESLEVPTRITVQRHRRVKD